MKKYIFLALLIAGLAFALPAYAVAPDPDNAAGIDLHSNKVVNGLVVGVSDTTSGNTIQVGPVGGIYAGSCSVYSGYTAAAQAYTGACVFVSAEYNPQTANDYLEIYDGTSRGNKTNILADIQGGVAKDTEYYKGPPIKITTGIYAHSNSGDGTWRIYYRIEDQGE